MPANVDSMFSVREVPWHREGIVLGDYPGSWAEARKLAGLDWDPITEAVYELSGVDEAGNPTYAPIDKWQRVARSDTGATLSLTQTSYTVITHEEMGGIIEAILEQPNVKYETAGSLSGGKAVWCLVCLDEPMHVAGDTSVTLPYVGVTARHDAMGAVVARATAVRIVCGNTFSAAELEGARTGATFSFQHRKNWRDHVDAAREAITGARREIARYHELMTELIGIQVTAKQRELFVREFIPAPPDGLITDRVMANVEQAREAIRNILASDTTKEVADSAYGLVQAAGEYLDHVRTARTWETKLRRTIISPEPLKARALKLAREVAAFEPKPVARRSRRKTPVEAVAA